MYDCTLPCMDWHGGIAQVSNACRFRVPRQCQWNASCKCRIGRNTLTLTLSDSVSDSDRPSPEIHSAVDAGERVTAATAELVLRYAILLQRLAARVTGEHHHRHVWLRTRSSRQRSASDLTPPCAPNWEKWPGLALLSLTPQPTKLCTLINFTCTNG